jgi:hypothetical protein
VFECGGGSMIDECGVCDGPGIPDGQCDCTGNVLDCAGECAGSAVEDDCGVCNGDGTSCLSVNLYFGEISANNLEIWMDNPLGVAGFQFNISGLTISGVSGGSAAENGFMVSNSATTVVGFSLTGALIPVGDALLMNLSFDGITGEDICLSDAVIADSSGNGIDYEVEPCLDPANYFNGACSDDSACNYVENTDYDDGSCTYAEENFDCDGNCQLEYDCAGECGGSATEDECGVCGGSGPEENYDCEGDCIVDIDCHGDCGGGAVYDNCGDCDIDPSNDCPEDCYGVWGGTAVLDECGNCTGGETGYDYNYALTVECWGGNWNGLDGEPNTGDEFVCETVGDNYPSELADCPINPDDITYIIYQDFVYLGIVQGATEYIDDGLGHSEENCYYLRYVEDGKLSHESDVVCASTNAEVLGCTYYI